MAAPRKTSDHSIADVSYWNDSAAAAGPRGSAIRRTVTDLGDAANDAPSDRAALVQMAKMGWVGLAIAEEFGGAGGTIVDLALW